MRTNPIEQLVAQSRGMVINVIPPPGEKSTGPSPSRNPIGSTQRTNYDSTSDNDTFVENIYSANIFTQYYDHKLFKPYFWMMMVMGWKPFPSKRVISTDPGILWKLSNFLYPLIIFAIVGTGYVFKLITCYHDFPQIHPTLGQNSSQCLRLFYPGPSLNTTISYNHSSQVSFESLYISKRIYFFGLTLPVKRNILFPLYVQEFYNNVLPETLLLLLVFYGYYLFRYKDWELAHTIMEMTFLKVQPIIGEEVQSDPSSSVKYQTDREKKLIQIRNNNMRRIKSFFDFKKVHFYTILWLCLAVVLLILRLTHIIMESGIFRTSADNASSRPYNTFIIVSIIMSSFLCYTTLALIFCTYLLLIQALLFMLRYTKERILNRQMDFDSAKKEFYRIKIWLEMLNSEFAFPLAIFMVVSLLRVLARAQMISRFWMYVQYSGKTFPQTFWVWRENGPTKFGNGTQSFLGTNFSQPEKLVTAALGVVHRFLPVFEIILSMLLYKMCLVYPLIKASQIRTAGKLHDYIGVEVAAKPYGFDSISQSSIDSFLAYTSTLKLESEMIFLKPCFAWFGTFIVFIIFVTPWNYGLH